MEAQPVRGRQADGARSEIGFGKRSLRTVGGSPDGKCRLGSVSTSLFLDRRALADFRRKRTASGIGPQAAAAECSKDAPQIAAGMTVHEHFACV